MLIVAPKGSTKDATSLSAPSFSEHSLFSGRVATEDVEGNAKIMAGIMPMKNCRGLRPPMVFTATE